MVIFMAIAVVALAQNLGEGKKLFEQKKFADAKKQLAAIDDDKPDYAAAQYYLGRIAFEEKKYDDASEFFEEAIDKNDKVAEYHYWLGAAYGTEASDANMIRKGILASKIKNAFEKCVALDPKHIAAMSGLVEFYLQAPSMMGGSMEKAVEMAKKIKAVDKPMGATTLANIYLKQNNHAEAEKEMTDLLKTDPNNANLVLGLGNVYLVSKKYQQGIDLYENFLKQNSSNMSITYQLGKFAAISGLVLDRGEACLKNYITNHKPAKSEPSHGGAYFRLGMIYEKRGNKAEAKKNYETSLKLDPDFKDAKEALKRVS